MFAEYLNDAQWQAVIPGIRICSVSAGQILPDPVPGTEAASPCLEIFFCRSGAAQLHIPAGTDLSLGGQEIWLLARKPEDLRLSGNPEGILLAADAQQAPEIFDRLCEKLGLSVSSPQVMAFLAEHSGICRVQSTAWSRAVFSVLQCLPRKEQARYCTMKSAELLYLICTRECLLRSTSALSPNWGYLAHTVRQMRAYMEAHLDEKLTIAAMSHRFHISPTAFKSCFRSLYGQPVHSWLLGQRMRRSAQLLTEHPMTVLQVAQDVGYESVGQFNVAFKRQYGVTPSQYRKMSQLKKV